MYEPPINFEESISKNSTMHLAMPKIKPLTINNSLIIDKFKKKYKEQIKNLKDEFSKKQALLEEFKNNIINFDKFGEITIIPENCSNDNNSIDQLTLNDTIEHECQHFYIFLLELAKTCIYFGRHFGNEIKNNQLYQLNEDEFIPLIGTYSNILLRIYNLIPEPKNIESFVKALIEISIHGKTSENLKYEKFLKSSMQFDNISLFYKLIWKDSQYGVKTKTKQNKIIQLMNLGDTKKFKKLVNWTIKNLKLNLDKNGK